ncbi:MAG: type II secretion system minor pseudopilin GspH [Gammaproteobacteria bacterium]
MNSVRLRARGFTLIEVLVVMVIIAIIAGVALISIGTLGRAPPAKHAAEQLSALTELASEQAVMTGEQYGLLISQHGYQFFVYDGEKWQPVQDDNTYRARHLGEDVILDLHLEGAPVKLASTAPAPAAGSIADSSLADTNDISDANASQVKPQIALLSSGEVTPFQLTISDTADPTQQYVITGSLSHGIKLKTPDDDDHGQ